MIEFGSRMIRGIIEAEVCVICRSRRLRQMTQTEALTISHIQREQNSISHIQREQNSITVFCFVFFVAKPFVVGISSIN